MTAGLQSVDLVKRRAMFALELIDPGRGVSAGKAMSVAAASLAPPSITRAGQFVWNDVNPPADRDVDIEASSLDGWFAPWAATIHVPARAPGVPIHVERVTLQPTGLYEPPAGTLAVAGMVMDNKQSRQPVVGVAVQLELRSSIHGTVPSSFIATSDARGGFVALASNPGSNDLKTAADGTLIGWLSLSSQQSTRYSALLPLRRARLLRAPEPYFWDSLTTTPPS